MSVGKIYIPSRDICEMSAPVSVSREFFCIRLPDAASILGTKALLKFEPTIRIQTSKPDFEKIIAFQTNAELPTIPTGSTSALDSSPGNLSFPPETPYISSNIPAPGLDYTLTPSSSATADTLSADTFNILKNKAILFGPKVSYPSDGVYFAYLTLLNGDAPKVTVYYDDAVDVKSQVYTYSQKSGYFNPRYDKRFSWDLKRDETETYFCVGGFTISSATFYWKESSAENWNSVSVSGENKNFVTIPANTFPAQSSIQWYVSATDQNGYTSQTAAYTLSTTDGTSTATPVFPINVTINGGIDNTFDWSVTNPTGEAHTPKTRQATPCRQTRSPRAERFTGPYRATTRTASLDLFQAQPSFQSLPRLRRLSALAHRLFHFPRLRGSRPGSLLMRCSLTASR